MTVVEKHIRIIAQLEWNRLSMFDGLKSPVFNITDFDIEFDGEDRLTAWIDDAGINDMLKQVKF